MSFASKWFHLNRFGRWCLSKTIGMNYYQGGRQEEDLCQDRAPHEISIGCSSSCITPPPNQISDSTLQCVTVVLQFSTSAHQGIATLHTHLRPHICLKLDCVYKWKQNKLAKLRSQVHFAKIFFG